MPPDPTDLIETIGLQVPPIGFYDAPDASPFEPLVAPMPGKDLCLFAFYRQWLLGKTLHITEDNVGCGSAGQWFFGGAIAASDDLICFLVDQEGLKASHDLMRRSLAHLEVYDREHPHLLIGPLRADQYEYLKSVTFYANPDQLAALSMGAHYHSAPSDPPPVIAPFSAGCSQLLVMFDDLVVPQAIIGATDIAMRHFLGPDQLAFTVTKPMFERLCTLDERSFLHKALWQTLLRARERKDQAQGQRD